MWVTVYIDSETELEKLNKEFPIDRYIYTIESTDSEHGAAHTKFTSTNFNEALMNSINFNDWGFCGKGNCTIKERNARGFVTRTWEVSEGKIVRELNKVKTK